MHMLFDIWNPELQTQTPIPLSLEFYGHEVGELLTHWLFTKMKGFGHKQVKPSPIVVGGHN